MNSARLIAAGLRFYWRTHVGVAAGAAVATAVLVGALVVGDSVRHSLRTIALRRLGNVEVAMSGLDRFFRAEAVREPNDLAAAIAADLGAVVAPALLLDGSVKRPDGTARANRVQVVGVDERFWLAGGARDLLAGTGGGRAVLNEPLARQLGAAVGEEVVVRVPVPTGLPRDAPLGSDRDSAAALRVTVRAVAGADDFGRFSLQANQVAPFTVFVPLKALQDVLGLTGRGNVLLVAARAGEGGAITPEAAAAALRRHWRLADADLELRRLGGNLLELRTGRVFLDEPVGAAALRADPRAVGVLTYFVHEARCGERAAPFCIVAAMDAAPPAPRADLPGEPIAPGPASPVPAGLADDEIVINDWLARDLGAAKGDRLELSYQVVGTMRTFHDRKRTFRVHSVVPISGPADDPNLMPDFPGLADVTNCRDWKPGVEIDLKKIRPKDEEYWNAHRGTPKAFISLAAGQEMWASRFGRLTAVRYRAGGGAEARIARDVLAGLDPAAIGLYFQPVRRQALAAAEPTSDFGGLFLGLSFFLIVAAVLLTALMFVFSIEQRSAQTGTLLALGFRPWRVRRLLLAEGGVLAVAGAAVGAAAGTAYTRAVLHGMAWLSWRGPGLMDIAVTDPATGRTLLWETLQERLRQLVPLWEQMRAAYPIRYHAEWSTLWIGGVIALAIAGAAMLVTLIPQGRAPARELLAAGAAGRAAGPAGRKRIAAALGLGTVCLLGAAALVIAAASGGAVGVEGAFFGSGGLLLLGSLSLGYGVLALLGRGSHAGAVSLAGLGLRTCGRRRWRSLATAGLLACGVFLVAAVEVFRLDPYQDAGEASSGTGGYALYGESAVPVLHDLNDPARRRKLNLAGDEMAGVRVVQMRLHEGDDASCLNLNRAQQPRLLGVEPGRLAGRFTFVSTLAAPAGDPWSVLDANLPAGVVPAVGDHDTLKWALHKAVGDELEVLDERGRTVRIRLAGEITGSIFQGNLLISERRFRGLFPSTSGYRLFLIDAPPASAGRAREALSAALEDFGLELTPAAERLARFAEVNNMYLSVFAALGGLGLLLGSLAMGIVVLRNVMERRGELALLRAVGFSRGQLRWLVLCEHWALLAMGLACGVGSAVVSVLPAVASPGKSVPYATWLTMLAGVSLSGVLWTYLAAAVALRGDLLPALRTE